MKCLTLILCLLRLLTCINSQNACHICTCLPHFSDCSGISNPPIFDETTAFYTETLMLNNVLFDTEDMSNAFMDVFIKLKRLYSLNSQLSCDYLQMIYPNGLVNITLVNSCYVWSFSTSLSEKTTQSTEQDVGVTSVTVTQTSFTTSPTADHIEETTTNVNASNAMGKEDRSILILAISTRVGFLLCIILTTFVLIMKSSLKFSTARLTPPIPVFPREFELDLEHGDNVLVNETYEEPAAFIEDSDSEE